jgi:hypothetical protein
MEFIRENSRVVEDVHWHTFPSLLINLSLNLIRPDQPRNTQISPLLSQRLTRTTPPPPPKSHIPLLPRKRPAVLRI